MVSSFAVLFYTLMLVIAVTGESAHSQYDCHYQQEVCECDPSGQDCYFDLYIEQLLSFTSYKLVDSGSGLAPLLNGPSWTYFINATTSLLQPVDTLPDEENPSRCEIFNEAFHENECSRPMTIDSVTEGVFYAVNGMIPGPTFVVTYNQTVAIRVHNGLFNDETSIHWHGLHQNSTPWMDGVGHITQCSISTYTSFQYIFKAIPSGTMWYHSHIGTQRTEGLFGSLVVRDTDEVNMQVEEELGELLEESFTIVDNPENTISMLDWQRDDLLDVTLRQKAQNPFFDFPRDRGPVVAPLAFETLLGPDDTEVSRIPYWAGLFNGRGRQQNVSYAHTRLSVFTIDFKDNADLKYYRFRLVGAMNRFMYRFSIAEHQLYVIATDGYVTKPKLVDYILIHAGERYDFLLEPKTDEGKTDYLMLAETLDDDPGTAEGFLHYGSIESIPRSTEYQDIVDNTPPRDCRNGSECLALNCPFENYPPDDYINCIPVTELQLLFPTEDELPSNVTRPGNEYFFDFAFTGSSGSVAVNGRNFVVPSGSLQTQKNQEMFEDVCELGAIDCDDDPDACICTQIVELNDTQAFATIQFVISSIGGSRYAAHPVHLHGHSFQVAGIFYGSEGEGGPIPNPAIECNDARCTNPRWSSVPMDGMVNETTVRKDTIVVPGGAYVVIRFVADNWGDWYMHCHIEGHLIQGMALVINEVPNRQAPPPDAMDILHCGNFNWTIEDFNNRETEPYYNNTEMPSSESDNASAGPSAGYWLLIATAMAVIKAIVIM